MDSFQKYILLVRGGQDESYKAFQDRVTSYAQRWANLEGVTHVKHCTTIESPPVFSVIPFTKDKASIISIYVEEGLMPAFEEVEYAGIYKVEEALPVSYKRDWPTNELTPGICLLTLFRKKKSIDYQTFIDRWHNGHTPLSLRIHPLWHYSRNVVNEKLQQSEDFDGIVDEHFRNKKDLLNPFIFFGNPLIIVQRMIKVYVDVRSFLDYAGIESYLAREVYLK